MIIINYGKFTIEADNVQKAKEFIEKENVNLQEATVVFKVKVPGIAFEPILQDVVGSGGVVL